MRGKKTEFADNPCPIARSLGIIGDWWSLLIIRNALGGPQRFGELQKSLGMAKNILAARLRKLVEAGILEAVPISSGEPSGGYRLTEKGGQLYIVLAALWQWGERFVAPPSGGRLQVVDRQTMQPLAPLELLNRNGRRLGPEDLSTRRV